MKKSFKLAKKQKTIQLFVLMGVVFLFFFNVVPMFGLRIAFAEYKITAGVKGFFTGEFVGLKYFKEFVFDYKFIPLMKNTLSISFLKLILSFPLPIFFAIILNETRNMFVKRIVQTVSYLPHFISWVIVSGLLFSFFSTTSGVINEMFMKIGLIKEPLDILTNPNSYYGLAALSEVWKETGWSAIIYLAAISSIDPSLYESAQIDGAGRLERIFYITLPSIRGTISILLILSIGSLLSAAGFEQSMLLGNSMNISSSEIIQTYIYKIGLGQGRYSYAAAAGLFQSVISLLLVLSANAFSRKFADTSLF